MKKKYVFKNNGEEKLAKELTIAYRDLKKTDKKLISQERDKKKRAAELAIANKSILFQNKENVFKAKLLNTIGQAVMATDLDGIINYWNNAAGIIYGWTTDEAIGKNVINLIYAKQTREQSFEIMSKLSQGDSWSGEILVQRKCGQIFPAFVTDSPVYNEHNILSGIIGVSIDITELKKTELKMLKSESQIRNFAAHLNNVVEDERASIAREIHDELGQQLVGIKIGLSSLKSPVGTNSKTEETINEMMNEIDTTIQSLRKIATQLRPGILDSLGLIPSIQWLGNEFKKKTNIKCLTEIYTTDLKFKKNISTCFFRICQESLTNILKHAAASEVAIHVKQNENELIMKISDNGKGMSSEKLENPFSMGLLGMHERANIIGGKLNIYSQKDQGTTIQLQAILN